MIALARHGLMALCALFDRELLVALQAYAGSTSVSAVALAVAGDLALTLFTRSSMETRDV